MSSQIPTLSLQPPLKDLVLGAVSDGAEYYYGKSEKDQADVKQWLDKAAAGEISKPTAVKDLDAQLLPQTYIVGNYLTAADVAIYGALHPVLCQSPAAHFAHPSVVRHFDHMQRLPPVRAAADALAPAFAVVPFDLESAPKPVRSAEPPKKKEKAPKAALEEGAAGAASKHAQPAESSGEKPQKKEKKEKSKDAAAGAAGEAGGKKKAAAGGKAAPAAEDGGEPVPSMIDLRVGHIIDIMKHPDADGLYVEQIDIGEETGPRTVVSGLVHYIPIEEMRDKYLVAVCNLKPANMRGVKSFAMVLCATSKDGKEAGIELIQPPPGSKPGDRVYFDGPEYENATPLSQLNPKKKIFETIQPGFTTLDTKEAAWVNPATKSVHRIRTSKGLCVTPTLVGASLS